jgi:nitrogenase molybdenum-iron protein alpha/beta subunit
MSASEDVRAAAYAACRVKDEAFWVEQEKNIQGALGQPCCTLSGIAASLMKTTGHFAVVVHGEDECASCFRHVGPAAVQFFCTGLTEQEFVTGRTSEPLRRCLRLIAEELAPDAIFVLGACPVEVIGDTFEDVVQSVGKEFPDIPMRALHTSGLKVGSQTAMLDWMFETLAGLPGEVPRDPAWLQKMTDAAGEIYKLDIRTPRDAVSALVGQVEAALADAEDERTATRDDCVVLLGLPRVRYDGDAAPEHVRILDAAGLRLLGNYPQATSLDQWRWITWAKHGFVADRSLYPKLVRRLEAAGQSVHEVPLPIGVKQSLDVYRSFGEATGRTAAIEEAVAPLAQAAEHALADFRARYGGLRMAYAIRMNNNYDADELAYQGLGDFFALDELGLEMTLLVQGPPDKRDRFEKMFERRGIKLPFEMFLEPWVMADLLQAGGYDVAYLADHCRNEANKAGVPMIPTRTLDPWLGGALRNLQRFDHLLRELRGAR